MFLHNSEVFFLHCFNEVSLELWLHCVANGVVACEPWVGEISQSEVFSNHFDVRVEGLKMLCIILGP